MEHRSPDDGRLVDVLPHIAPTQEFILDFVAELGISKATAYRYVGPDGELRASAIRVLELQGQGQGQGKPLKTA